MPSPNQWKLRRRTREYVAENSPQIVQAGSANLAVHRGDRVAREALRPRIIVPAEVGDVDLHALSPCILPRATRSGTVMVSMTCCEAAEKSPSGSCGFAQ